MIRPQRIAVALLLVAGLGLLAACGNDAGGGDGEALEVTASDFSFDPTTLEVEPGAEVTVTLINDGEAEHSFSIEDPEVEVEAEGGEEAETSFTAPDEGTLDFFCKYHPTQMTGELVVGGGGASGGNEETSETTQERDY
jgi:plastocyanin